MVFADIRMEGNMKIGDRVYDNQDGAMGVITCVASLAGIVITGYTVKFDNGEVARVLPGHVSEVPVFEAHLFQEGVCHVGS